MTLKAISLIGVVATLIGCGPVDGHTYTMTPDGKLTLESNVDAIVEDNLPQGEQEVSSASYSAMACSRTYCFYMSSCGCSSGCSSAQCWSVCKSCFGY